MENLATLRPSYIVNTPRPMVESTLDWFAQGVTGSGGGRTSEAFSEQTSTTKR